MPKKYIGDLIELIQSTVNDPNNKDTERVRKALVTLNVIKTKRHQIGFSV